MFRKDNCTSTLKSTFKYIVKMKGFRFTHGMVEICLRMNMSMKDIGTRLYFVMENEAIPSKHIYVNTLLVEHI